ncbi:hypothetical protein CYMTET_20859 [Cymbomonas tetramitiformis]|uniref:protein-tyrosine-phosphatase n=1 Tax=Cymbomonas tetramitiformis TaxID=36881 RepID=A0AAE0L3G4_9CHLO|nr:hypothetical protein CYMTET_20859 [Cymbomonas tetramitiformis]
MRREKASTDNGIPFKTGTLKAACFTVLAAAGKKGARVQDIVKQIQDRKLAPLAGATPANTICSALSSVESVFCRIAPGTYALLSNRTGSAAQKDPSAQKLLQGHVRKRSEPKTDPDLSQVETSSGKRLKLADFHESNLSAPGLDRHLASALNPSVAGSTNGDGCSEDYVSQREACIQVLADAGPEGLSVAEVVSKIVEKNLARLIGRTPHNSITRCLSSDENFFRIGPGHYALRGSDIMMCAQVLSSAFGSISQPPDDMCNQSEYKEEQGSCQPDGSLPAATGSIGEAAISCHVSTGGDGGPTETRNDHTADKVLQWMAGRQKRATRHDFDMDKLRVHDLPSEDVTTEAATLDHFAGSMLIASFIQQGLFQGGMDAAMDLKLLKEHHITHVLNLTRDVPNFHEEAGAGICYLRIPLDAGAEEGNVLERLAETSDFIALGLQAQGKKDEARSGVGGVLVHCRSGVSHSAVATIAYACLRRGWKLQDVWQAMRCARNERGMCVDMLHHTALLQIEEQVQGTWQSTHRTTRSRASKLA